MAAVWTVPANKGKRLPGEVLMAQEVRALVRACGRSASGVRNAALVAVMFGAALRVSEALALRLSDLDLELGTVRVRRGKGDKSRTVALDPGAQGYLERWLAKRAALGLNGRQPVFCTITRGPQRQQFGEALDPSYVRRLLPRLAGRAGLERRVHPHALRHSLASALAHEGKSLPAISAQLGHSSTAVTDRYLRKIAPTELVAQIRDRSRLEA
jgi:integrase/recombinase XerD